MDTRIFYDRISGVYDLLADASEGACRHDGLCRLGVVAGERVLEVGFGTGHGLTTLAEAVGPAGRVVGVDVSSGMLRVARRAVERAGVTTVALALGDARSLCFRNAVFDAAFMSFTLELFDLADIAVVLAEIRRVLRPTGRLGVVAMMETGHSTAMTDIYNWLHRHFPHFVDCRPINIAKLLRNSGFSITDTHSMSVWGLSVASVVGTSTTKTVYLDSTTAAE